MVAPLEQERILPNLRLERVLGRGAHSVVWSAASTGDVSAWGGQRALVVKIALEGSADHGAMLRREARFLARIAHPHVIRLLAVETTDDGRDYVVLPMASGGSLVDRLKSGPLPLEAALTVGRATARALEAVHRLGVVHRDVKPGNMLLSDEPGVWLADFGLAEDLALARHGLGAGRVAGSVLYAAPEQTGMVRREVDGRADLYALGAVLFECLSGRPPFQGDEAETLLQLHATARPPDVRMLREDTPAALAELIARLLGKDPDDRPASAGEVLEQLDAVSGSSVVPRVRVCDEAAPAGRELEVDELRRALAALATGHGKTLCVTGEEGAGKRQICEAALATLSHVRVLRAPRRQADGSSFAQFRSLVSELVREAGSAEDEAERTRELLARHAPALSRLFPGLIDAEPPREELSRDLALDALARLLAESGSQKRPSVILFEGADELDAAGSGALLRLHMQVQTAPVLLLCLGETRPFADLEHPVAELALGPLERTSVERIVRDVLGPLPVPPRLVDLLLTVSGGNPEALRLALARALDEGVLETDGRRWLLDEPRLFALDTLRRSDRALDATLDRLDATLLLPLRHAALLGRRFDPRWLELLGHSPRRVSEAIWHGIQRRVLSSVNDGLVTFAHVAVRNALFAELSDAERARLYGALVTGLEQNEPLDRRGREVLAHAYLGSVQSHTAQRAWERCLEAGLSELDAYAFDEARVLLESAQELCTRFSLSTDFRLLRALGQLEAQGGNVDAAIAKFRLAIGSCPDPLERATMHTRCAELRFFNEAGHTRPMREHLELAYREFGWSMPRPSVWCVFVAVWYALCATFVELTGIRSGVDGTTQHARTRLRMYELSGMYFFWTQRVGATLRMCMQGWYYGVRTGPCREYGYGVAGLANLFEIFGFERRAERYYRQGCETAEALRDTGLYAYIRYMRGIGLFLGRAGKSQRGERILLQTFERHGGELDISYLAQAAANLTSCAMARGDLHRALHLLDRVREQVAARLGRHAELPETCVLGQLDLYLHTGRIAEAEAVVERMKKRLSDPQEDPLGWLTRWHAIATFEFARGGRDEAIDHAMQQAARSPLSPRGAVWLTSRSWLLVGYVRLTQYLRSTPEDKPKRTRDLLAIARLVQRAPSSPYIDGHVAVFRAVEHWLEGRTALAERALTRAETEGHRHDAPAVLVEARALRARMLLDLGHDGPSRSEARCAAALAEASGLLSRAREIERAFLVSRDGTRTITATSNASRHRDLTGVSNVQRERDALLEVTVAASRELEPESQARAVLDRLIALLGAERGLIFADGEAGEMVRLSGRTAQRDDLPLDVTYAQSLVSRVRETAVPLVLSGTEEGKGLGSESMVAGNLRSMVCAPIRLGDQTRGVIYLDSSLARGVFTRRDLEILEAMGSQIALTQEMARSARMQVERLALEKDLALSGTVQALFLPKQRDVALGPVSVSAAYVPVSHSGGDFWTHERRADGRVWVLVADATGHGAGAAMVTAQLAGSYRSLVDLGVEQLPELLARLHGTALALCAGRYAATLTALEVSADGTRATLFSAGGPPVLLRAPSGEVDAHVLRGTPLGTTPFALGQRSFELKPGASLLVVTDGVFEMPTSDGRELGARRLSRLFSRHGSESARATRDGLMDALVSLRGEATAADDLTLLVIAAR